MSLYRLLSGQVIVATVIALLLVPSAYIAWTWRDMPHFGQGHDDSIYFVAAKSFAEGQGYRIASFPGRPWETKYPPLLPAFLSIVWRIAPEFPANLALATLFSWLWLPAWVALGYRVYRDLGLNRVAAVGLCGLMALSCEVVQRAMTTQAEIMFAVLWTLSAALSLRRGSSAAVALLAGVIGAAAYLTKTSGLPLLLAGPMYFGIRRQFRSAIAFAAGMLPAIIGWTLWMRGRIPRGKTDPLTLYYTDYLGYHLYNVRLLDLSVLLAKNVDGLLSSMGGLFLDWSLSDTSSVAIVMGLRAAGIVMLVGTVRHFRRVGITPYHTFALGYTALLLIWHYPPNGRFLLPIMPVLLAGFCTEICAITDLLRRKSRALAVVFAAALGVSVLSCGAVGWVHLYDWLQGLREVRAKAYYPAYEWISKNTTPEARFLASEDVVLYLHTGRMAMSPVVPMHYFYRNDKDGVLRYMTSRPDLARQHGLEYVVSGPRDWRRELLPSQAAEQSQTLSASGEVAAVFRSNGVAVYKVNGARLIRSSPVSAAGTAEPQPKSHGLPAAKTDGEQD